MSIPCKPCSDVGAKVDADFVLVEQLLRNSFPFVLGRSARQTIMMRLPACMWLHEASCFYDGDVTFLVGLHNEFTKLFSGRFFWPSQAPSVYNLRSGLHHGNPIHILSIAAPACLAGAGWASFSCRDNWHDRQAGNPNLSCLSQRPKQTHMNLCTRMSPARHFVMAQTQTSNLTTKLTLKP